MIRALQNQVTTACHFRPMARRCHFPHADQGLMCQVLLGGKADPSAHQSFIPSGDIVLWRDGDLSSSALKILAQHHQSGSAVWRAKRQLMEKPSLYDLFSSHSKSLVKLATADDEEVVWRKDHLECISGCPLQPMLGIRFVLLVLAWHEDLVFKYQWKHSWLYHLLCL